MPGRRCGGGAAAVALALLLSVSHASLEGQRSQPLFHSDESHVDGQIDAEPDASDANSSGRGRFQPRSETPALDDALRHSPATLSASAEGLGHFPGDTLGNEAADLVSRGDALLRDRQPSHALTVFRTALSQSRRSHNAMRGIVLALMRLGRLREAAAAASEWVKGGGADAAGHGGSSIRALLANALYRLGAGDAAVRAFSDAAAAFPTDTLAWHGLADALLAEGRSREAVAVMEHAVIVKGVSSDHGRLFRARSAACDWSEHDLLRAYLARRGAGGDGGAGTLAPVHASDLPGAHPALSLLLAARQAWRTAASTQAARADRVELETQRACTALRARPRVERVLRIGASSP